VDALFIIYDLPASVFWKKKNFVLDQRTNGGSKLIGHFK